VSSVTAQVIYSEQPPIAATLAEWQQALVPPMPRGSDGKPAEENEARGAV
jgi:hypothetical protein